jgi:Fip1 motif
MEPANRSLDLRCVIRVVVGTSPCSPSSLSQAKQALGAQRELLHTPKRFAPRYCECNVVLRVLFIAPPPPGLSLTTEYTPRERGGPAKPPAAQPSVASTPIARSLTNPNIATPLAAATASASPVPDTKPKLEDGPDPTTLPPVAAPPSHPAIDPTATGMLEGRPVFEVDMAALADKAWRRPGSDISDWFNYGFDEISWEAYCYRRRELGDLAAVLKTNVVVRILPQQHIS